MLVVSRKPGEGIVIGDDVTLTILEVRGKRVRLGFTAPSEIPIWREEIDPRSEDCVPTCADHVVRCRAVHGLLIPGSSARPTGSSQHA
jgi:carbon storage regulator